MTDYMQMLRKFVGHRPVMQCAASMIVYNNEKGVLLQRRKDNDLWCYHGGAVELGEQVEETAKRELFEETGLIASSFSLLGVYSGQDQYYKYPNNDEVFIIDVVYICREFLGEINQENSEVSELKWFQLNEIPSNIMPPIKNPMKEFVKLTLQEKN